MELLVKDDMSQQRLIGLTQRYRGKIEIMEQLQVGKTLEEIEGKKFFKKPR